MALTSLQRDVCRLLADERRRSGESYLAGGATLNDLLAEFPDDLVAGGFTCYSGEAEKADPKRKSS